jgi:hypothetical protein
VKKPVLTSVLVSILFLISLAVNLLQFKTSRVVGTAPNTAAISSKQNDIICDVAKEQLKENWAENQKNIERVFQVVNSSSEMDSKLFVNLEEISNTINPSKSLFEGFKVRYEKLFNNHVSQFRKFLNRKPESDWASMLHTLKEFYAAEDRLVGELFGQESLEKFRLSQARKRTPTLAIVAQYAKLDWEQSLKW